MLASQVKVSTLPLHQKHEERGAKFGEFGEWLVPLYYSSILEEHHAVRTHAGVFDISHMGEFWICGPKAEGFLNQLLPRDVIAMESGQAQYMPLLREDAGILDDVILYKIQPEKYLLIVNAGNVEKDFAWVKSQAPSDVQLQNVTQDYGLLAIQGPKSSEILCNAFHELNVSDLGYYRCREWGKGIVARTGYTGEDGFELMVPKEELVAVWDALFKDESLVPVGFGCRDTLRLEAGMLLYGHDMTEERNPYEARISWAIDLQKESFVGRDALQKIKSEGARLKVIGFELLERGIPREDYIVRKDGQDIGKVTSGTMSPTLQKAIGLAYVPADVARVDNEIEIVIRDRPVKAKIVKLPFYKRNKS